MKLKKTILIASCALSVLMGVTFAQIPENKKELEDKHTSLMREISETQKILNETQEERKTSMAQLKALQSQVNNRQALIKNLDNEIVTVNNDIKSKTQEIDQLTAQIAKLRKVYAQSVRYSYKNQSAHNILAFILTADNFNDGMRRYQYMKKNRDFRKHQADQLKTGQAKIANNIKTLDSQKRKNEELKVAQVEQNKTLIEESKLTQSLVDELRGKETDLTASIAKKRDHAKKLDGIIKDIIKEEIRITQKKKAEEEKRRLDEENKRQQEIARVERERQQEQLKREQEQQRKLELERQRIREEEKQKQLIAKQKEENNKTLAANTPTEKPKVEAPVLVKTPVSTPSNKPIEEKKTETTPVNVKENTVVASNTKPVEPPKVTRPDNPPPTYKNSLSPDMQTTSSNFQANKGRLPSPISGGYVSAPYGKYPHPLEPKVTLENLGIDLASKPGTGVKCVFNGTVTTVVSIAGTYTVIVNHGEYFTVYSNLSSASVSKGQIVSANQSIGVVGANDEGEHIVHFEVCRVGSGNTIVNENPSVWIAR